MREARGLYGSGARTREQQEELFKKWDNGRRIRRVTPIGPIRGERPNLIIMDDLNSTHRQDLTDEEREEMRRWVERFWGEGWNDDI